MSDEDKKSNAGKGVEKTIAAPTPAPVVNPNHETGPAPESDTFEGTPVHRAVHAWMGKFVQDSPISRNTEIYNYLVSKLPALAEMINGENKA